ncbi:hypothetical protein BASA81_013774 [Batrachochytrium salamandrivorans]|nr:hypothetical protein BASA81_013774 [Batrachochytrium salamandrivorans]
MADDAVFSRDAQQLLKRTGSFLDTLNSNTHTHHRGWLRKLASNGKKWNRRFFVSHGHYLSYFLNEDEVGGTNKNLIGALDMWRVERVSLEDNMISIEFQLDSGALERVVNKVVGAMSNKMLLQAEDSKEASHWVTCLKLTPFPPLSPPPPPSPSNYSSGDQEVGLDPALHIQLLSIKLSETKELHFTEVLDATRFRIGEVKDYAWLTIQVHSQGKPLESKRFQFFPDFNSNQGELVIKVSDLVNVELQWEVDTEMSVDELIRVLAREEDPHPLFLQIPLALALFSVTLVIAKYVLEFKLAYSVVIAALFSIPAVSLLGEVFREDDNKVMDNQSGSPKRFVISKLKPVHAHRAELAAERVAKASKEARKQHNVASMGGRDVSLLPEELGKLEQFKLAIAKSDMAKPSAFCELSRAMKSDWKCQPTSNSNRDVYDFVWDKYTKHDFRLVRFLRARKMDVIGAEKMLRSSLLWRIQHRADLLLSEFPMPKWVLNYGASELLQGDLGNEGMDQRCEERIDKFWLRDKQGCLAMFLRIGHFDWKQFYGKLKRTTTTAMPTPTEMMIKMGMWVLELGRLDSDFVHERTNGMTPSYLTLVIDLGGFSLSQQMPLAELAQVVKRFLQVILASYPELIKKICVINTPFLFHGVWQAMKPFIPDDLERKIAIHSGKCDYHRHLADDFERDQVPEYLGGLLQGVKRDPFCKNRLPPAGPFLTSDRGQRWLNGSE